MKKGLVAILFLACAALLAGNVMVYLGEDRKGPEISIPQETISYVEGTDTSALLAGVTASDKRDGDVTDTVTIESIIPGANGTEASVVYVAKDSKNNVTKETRKVQYTTDANTSASADGAGTSAVTGQETQPTAEPQNVPEPQPTDDGEAQNEAAIAALSPESPRFYLTQYSVEVERGAQFNGLSYVKDIVDDSDDRNELFQGIQISGDADTNTPGEYILEYHVSDSDGNKSNVAQLKVIVK